MAEDPQERTEERETKTSSPTNSETKCQPTTAGSDSAPSPHGSSATHTSCTGKLPVINGYLTFDPLLNFISNLDIDVTVKTSV